MKTKLLRLWLTALMLLVTSASYAYDVEIDGIYYNLIPKAKTAEVTYGGAQYSASYSGTVVIPESITHEGIEYKVESIGYLAFCSCSSLTSVTIPTSVTTIGVAAFLSCRSLSSITIPNSVTSIGKEAFERCSSLISITIPSSVTTIEYNAFCECSSLSSITIPTSVTSIGWGAFYNCKNLEAVYCSRETPPTTEANAFEDSYIEFTTLYVPEEVIDKYKATTPWSTFGTILPLQCEAPQVQYADATLTITSATPGAKCYYSIECEDATETTEVQGPITLAKTYTIIAYAEAEGFKTSEPTTLKLSASQLAEGDVDGNGKLSISDVTTLINNILKK